MDNQQEMEMLGHDNVIQDFEHGIMPLDAFLQFLFHHLSKRGEFHMRPVAVVIGFVKPPGNLSERLIKPFCHTDGDMIITAATIVM